MKLKKVLAIAMASAMIMGMSVTTFAAPSVSGNAVIAITDSEIQNVDTEYSYVQIVTRDATSSQGWKFTDQVYAQAFITAFHVDTEEKALKALMACYEGTDNNNASAGTIHSSEELGSALEAIKNQATTSVENKTISVTTAGLYLIVGHATGYTWVPMLAYVDENEDGTLENANVTAKASKDQIGKEIVVEDNSKDTGNTVMEGDIIDYKITAEYPYYPSNAENPKFVITDKLENATINEDSIAIKNFAKDEDYTITVDSDKKGMEITFNYDIKKAGQPVVINYNATVGDISNGENVKNTAKSEIETGYTVAEVITDSASFEVTKEAVGSEHTPLSGAEFTIYVKDSKGTDKIKYNEEEIQVRRVKVLTTDDNGKATIKGLDAEKDYYVKETKAPAGYSLNETVYKLVDAKLTKGTPIYTTETDDKNVTYTKVTITNTVTDFKSETVEDSKLSSLPSTGGIGTTIFTIGGCAIMVTAAGLYFASRKKREEK